MKNSMRLQRNMGVIRKIDQNRQNCLKKDTFFTSVTPCSYGGFFCLLDQGVSAGPFRV
jgi:hypothetical protein